MLNTNILKNKKGNSLKLLIYVIIILFSLAFLTILAYLLLSSYDTAFTATGLDNEDTDKVFSDFGGAILMFDHLGVIILAAVLVGLSWMAYKNPFHPIVYVGMWVMAPFLALISVIFNLIYVQFINTDLISAIYPLFPKLTIIATNLHWVMLAMIVLFNIVKYLKTRSDEVPTF